jgi:DNA-binding transcriptional regulator YdaS (Cro superfamily)
MKLEDYINWKKLAWADFAKILGVDPTYMSRLKHGKISWSPEMALKVEQATDGHVTKESLVWPDV